MHALVDTAARGNPQMRFALPVRFERSEGWVIAHCDPLDVVSQGRDRDSARAAITEAVSLFLETCFEMGTLESVLRDRGFTRLQPVRTGTDLDEEMIEVPLELVTNAKAQAGELQTAR